MLGSAAGAGTTTDRCHPDSTQFISAPVAGWVAEYSDDPLQQGVTPHRQVDRLPLVLVDVAAERDRAAEVGRLLRDLLPQGPPVVDPPAYQLGNVVVAAVGGVSGDRTDGDDRVTAGPRVTVRVSSAVCTCSAVTLRPDGPLSTKSTSVTWWRTGRPRSVDQPALQRKRSWNRTGCRRSGGRR